VGARFAGLRGRTSSRPLRLLSIALLGVLAATGLTGCHGAPHAQVVASGLDDHTAGVLAVESRPGGPVYFSDSTSIYVLTMAG